MDEKNNAINEVEENEIEAPPVVLEIKRDDSNLNLLRDPKIKIDKDVNTDKSIVSSQLPKINPTIITDYKEENKISEDINFIGALEGFIVLILICMIVIGLSNLFKKRLIFQNTFSIINNHYISRFNPRLKRYLTSINPYFSRNLFSRKDW